MSEKSPKLSSKPQINATKRFAFLVLLVVFIAGAIYYMATFQFLEFFILALVTFIIIQILNYIFDREKENKKQK